MILTYEPASKPLKALHLGSFFTPLLGEEEATANASSTSTVMPRPASGLDQLAYVCRAGSAVVSYDAPGQLGQDEPASG